MTADLLHTVIADVETIESLPVGAVLAGGGMAWQKQEDGWWYPSSFSWIKQRGAAVMAGYEPTLIWLPTEPADSAEAAIRRACTGSDDYARENVESLMRITAELLGYDVVKVADR